MIRRAALLAPLVLLTACGSHASVPDEFSGAWVLTDGRAVPIRHVSTHDGIAALRALGGAPCTQPALYYRSTYFGGVAHMAGCATGNGKILRGRFNDRGIRGSLELRLQGRNRFAAIVHGDGHAPFTVRAKRITLSGGG